MTMMILIVGFAHILALDTTGLVSDCCSLEPDLSLPELVTIEFKLELPLSELDPPELPSSELELELLSSELELELSCPEPDLEEPEPELKLELDEAELGVELELELDKAELELELELELD